MIQIKTAILFVATSTILSRFVEGYGIRSGKIENIGKDESAIDFDKFENNIEKDFAETFGKNAKEKLATSLFVDRDHFDEIVAELQTAKAKQMVYNQLHNPIDEENIPEYALKKISFTQSIQNTVNETIEEESYCPSVRYKIWKEQPTGFKWVAIAGILTIFPKEWDYEVPINNFESASYEVKTPLQKAVLGRMGYDEDKFDCCSNHFEDYYWSDFTKDYGNGIEYEEQIAALKALGYDQFSWDNDLDVPVDYMEWSMLSNHQQEMAASKLCWTETLWDQYPMNEWDKSAKLPDYW